MNKKYSIGGVVLLIIAAFFGYRFTHPSITAGDASTSFPNGLTVGGGTYAVSPALAITGNTTVSGTFAVGSAGTSVTQLNTGTCYIQPYATTIAASSTANVDCQATAAIGSPTNTAVDTPLLGVRNLDNVVASLSTTTAGTTFEGLDLIGTSASTTNGYITLRLSNATGGTFTWPLTGTASGTASYVSTR